jgi:hypothetical protein
MLYLLANVCTPTHLPTPPPPHPPPPTHIYVFVCVCVCFCMHRDSEKRLLVVLACVGVGGWVWVCVRACVVGVGLGVWVWVWVCVCGLSVQICLAQDKNFESTIFNFSNSNRFQRPFATFANGTARFSCDVATDVTPSKCRRKRRRRFGTETTNDLRAGTNLIKTFYRR